MKGGQCLVSISSPGSKVHSMSISTDGRRRIEPVTVPLFQPWLANGRTRFAGAIILALAGFMVSALPSGLLRSAEQGEPKQAKPGEAEPEKSASEPAKPRLAAELHQDFRNSALDTRTMSRVGGYAEEFVRPDKEGLRIRVPPGLNSPEAVGVAPRCRIRGDFEITVSFAIVKADEPIRGYGVAAAIWAETNTPTREAVTIERGVIPRAGERYTLTRISGPSQTRKYDVRRALAQSRSGKLRMERTGSQVTTLFADGKEAFRVLRKVDLGPEDVALVRLGADTGVSDHSIEILLEDVTIRAEALPGLRPSPRASSDSPVPSQPPR